MSTRMALVVALLAGVRFASAQGVSEQLGEACRDEMRREGIVGMSVAVFQEGRPVFVEAFGYADRERNRKAVPSTLFRLGSIAKSVTATSWMRLVDRREASLDADIRTYIPEYPAKAHPFNAAQLLSHTAGIRHYQANRVDDGFLPVTPLEAVMRLEGDPLLYVPGSRHSYSTHAFGFIARAIEVAARTSFADFIRAEITPVAAGELDVEVSTDRKPARSALYQRLNGNSIYLQRRQDISWKAGGGGMESTAAGLARFADAVLAGRLVSPAARDLMWKPTTLSNGSRVNYGLGWAIYPPSRVGHGGSQQGCSSSLLIDRERRVIAVVMANTQSVNVGRLSTRLVDIVSRTGTQTLDEQKPLPLSSR